MKILSRFPYNTLSLQQVSDMQSRRKAASFSRPESNKTLILNLGNSFPFGQFGLVDNEDEHEFVPFMVCYYADQRTKLNTVNVEMARSKREAQIAQRRKASRYVVDAEE